MLACSLDGLAKEKPYPVEPQDTCFKLKHKYASIFQSYDAEAGLLFDFKFMDYTVVPHLSCVNHTQNAISTSFSLFFFFKEN